MENIALPHTLPPHPRLSRTLGPIRLVPIPGSHEVCVSNPQRVGETILLAGHN